MVSIYVRRHIPLVILTIVALLLTYNYYTGELGVEVSRVRTYGIVAGNFAVLLATTSFLMRSFASITRYLRERAWRWIGLHVYSLAVFATFLGTYLLRGMAEEYDWLSVSIMNPSYTTSWALTAFYCAAAVYRSWRIRNLETALLVIAAVFSALAQAPGVVAVIPGSDFIGTWLTEVISKGGYRVFTITAGIAATAILIRSLRGRMRGFE